MRKQAAKFFSAKKHHQGSAIVELIEQWTQKFVRVDNLYSYDRRIKDIAIVLLSKYRTQMVTDCLEEFVLSTSKSKVILLWYSYCGIIS